MHSTPILKILCQKYQKPKPAKNSAINWKKKRSLALIAPPVQPISPAASSSEKKTMHNSELGKPKTELWLALRTLEQLKTELRLQLRTASLFLTKVIFSSICKKEASSPTAAPIVRIIQ